MVDVIDRLHEDQDNAEQGVELLERNKVPAEFIAGNKLTDALDRAEHRLGKERVANFLQLWLNGERSCFTGRELIELKAAIELFRANVTPANFETRLKNRIARLRS